MSIELKNCSYTYAPGTSYAAGALRNVSLTVEDGEFIGIMGKTGCGKSTMIQLMAGLLTPEGGQVLIDGCDIHSRSYDRKRLRRRVGVVFQHPEHQLFETTVEKDVAFGLKSFDWTAEEKKQAIRQALEAVGFEYEAVRQQSPLQFSGGEKRRIAIAGVLAAKPGILILDEPIAGLDPLGRRAFLELMDRLNRQGTTIVMISHNADAIAEHAHRVLLLEQGQLIEDGPVEQIFSHGEFLRNHGIRTSQAGEIADLLRAKGVELDGPVVRYEQLLSQLLRWKGGGEK